MVDKKFGDAGGRLLIEEFLRGREVSFIVIADGAKALPLVTTMDHKTVFDGGQGPNTGGMGTISPSPYLNRKMYAQIMSTIILPTITRMLEEGRKYKGALYAGLMLTDDGPKVLEYNCRFGDPETQPQMLRLESDLVDILMAAVAEDVLANEVTWSRKAARLRHPGLGRISRPVRKGQDHPRPGRRGPDGGGRLSRRHEIRERPVPARTAAGSWASAPPSRACPKR